MPVQSTLLTQNLLAPRSHIYFLGYWGGVGIIHILQLASARLAAKASRIVELLLLTL